LSRRRAGNLAGAGAWIRTNGPKLERCAKRNPTTKISDELNGALESMVINSDDAGRNLCIQLVGEPYILTGADGAGRRAPSRRSAARLASSTAVRRPLGRAAHDCV